MIKNRVQLLNPRSKRYVLVDTKTGQVLRTKRTPGPYRNVEIKTPRAVQDPPPNAKATVDPQAVERAVRKVKANR
jgi:hypothetical protein